MCGIAGIVSLNNESILNIEHYLSVMLNLIKHRGPDDSGIWVHENAKLGFAHSRLSVIDLNKRSKQPMKDINANVISFNGEIYNYKDLQNKLSDKWDFCTSSDTETILAAYEKYGMDFFEHFRGMFAFSLWNEKENKVICARDRFGIKPFYYTIIEDMFIFASEIKAILPFVSEINIDETALTDYLVFQYTLGEKTLFKGIKQLLPGHYIEIKDNNIKPKRYWDIQFNIDFDHSPIYFEKRLKELVDETINLHLTSDVPVGSYLSGGVDSSLITVLASKKLGYNINSFHGKFLEYPGFDESLYAKAVSEHINGEFNEISITAKDFKDNIEKVIYYMDYPVAGPGAFAQFMTSKLAASKVKVVLGGQGGDEIFGGYARYLIAYFEQCIKASIEGTYKEGNFVVTPESIIPNLEVLKEYKPLIKDFWKEGLFSNIDDRYFRLIDRSINIQDEINWSELNKENIKSTFKRIFNNDYNVGHNAYFDKMTHFDLKCLLPALLHVEDRMSMAHGLESRIPLLDHKLVEFVATAPADVKFKDGKMKHLLKTTFNDTIPSEIFYRRDKMGFPVPLKNWFNKELKDWLFDIFNNNNSFTRPFVNTRALLTKINIDNKFSREIWGLLCLELWYQIFYDKANTYKQILNKGELKV